MLLVNALEDILMRRPGSITAFAWFAVIVVTMGCALLHDFDGREKSEKGRGKKTEHFQFS